MAVWSVTEEDEAHLDRYEGWPDFYYKADVTLPIRGIKTGKIRTRTAFIYIMHEDRDFGIPSPYYIQTCKQGYNSFGFDQRILAEALDYTLEMIDQQAGADDEEEFETNR